MLSDDLNWNYRLINLIMLTILPNWCSNNHYISIYCLIMMTNCRPRHNNLDDGFTVYIWSIFLFLWFDLYYNTLTNDDCRLIFIECNNQMAISSAESPTLTLDWTVWTSLLLDTRLCKILICRLTFRIRKWENTWWRLESLI